MLKRVCLFAPALTACTTAPAQPKSITFNQVTRVFRLDGGNMSYAFGVNARGELQQIYLGGCVAPTDAFSQAAPHEGVGVVRRFLHQYTSGIRRGGSGLYVEPALKITFADGIRDLVLRYDSHSIGANSLEVVLKDIERPIFVILHYSIDADTGILARSATIENRGKDPVTVEQAAAAAWSLPAAHYTLNYLTGRWAGEWTLTQETLDAGARVLECRRSSIGHQANPWFALQQGDAQEGRGFPILKLRVLDSSAQYAVTSIEGKLHVASPGVA